MEVKDNDFFYKWYDNQKILLIGIFKKKLKTYCRADTELLSKAVLKFRHLFKKNLDIDPFRYVTLASLCMSNYINNFMPNNSIVGNSCEKRDSLICREWLASLDNENIKKEFPIRIKKEISDTVLNKNKIVNPINNKEFKRLTSFNKPITVDGYDIKTNKAYQFQGCYWHGCRKCHPDQIGRYNKTIEQVNILENEGINVIQIWECEWNKQKQQLPNKKELEDIARHENINIRNAFFGGRTEGFKQYHKSSDTEKIFYYDIVSLYPTVNALDDYAVGFGHYVNLKIESVEELLNTDKFIGIIKVDIEPQNK